MADQNELDIERELEALRLRAPDQYRAILDQLNITSTAIQQNNQSLLNMGNYATTAQNGILGFFRKLADINVIDAMREVRNNIDNVTVGTEHLGAKTAMVFANMLGVLPKATDMYRDFGRVGADAGDRLTSSFGKFLPILSKLPGISEFAPAIQNMLSSADVGRNIENSIVSAMAAQGDLNAILKDNGAGYVDLATQATSFVEQTYNVAKATGNLSSTISQYALDLAKIPGALRTNIELHGDQGQSLSALEASVKIASAYQMEHSEVVKELNFAYRDLGTTGTKAFEFVARMASASQDLNLPMDIVRQNVEETSRAFKLFGDNSQAAINILDRFSPALRDSGLGPAAINELVSGMTSGIQQMDIAHKAFISGASGGRGGLAGGFEIDLLLQQGKVDEVLQKTMSAMQAQFGGPITTLEDVQRNPEMSGQLLKEISFLKNVAGIAKSDAAAYQILEMMKKGGATAEEFARATKTPEEALAKSIELGGQIQERQNNEIIRAANEIEKWTSLTAVHSSNLVRGLLGADSVNAQNIARAMRAASQESTTIGSLGVAGSRSTSLNQGIENSMTLEGAEEAVATYGGALKDSVMGVLPSAIKNLFNARTGSAPVPEQGRINALEADILSLAPAAVRTQTRPPRPDVMLAPERVFPQQADGTGTQTAAGTTRSNIPDEHVLHIKNEQTCAECMKKIAIQEAKIVLNNQTKKAYDGIGE